MYEEAMIRIVKLSDAPELLRIYTPYVLNTSVTPEFDVPSLSAFKDRIRATKDDYPYLVYGIGKKIAGFAYAHKYRHAAGHQWSVEVSVYLAGDMQGKGIARLLYDTLFRILKLQGFENVFAGIVLPNRRSISFHQKMGFSPVGTFKKGIFKLGKWHDVRWMEYALALHAEDPFPPKPFKTVARSSMLRDIITRAN